MPTQDPRPVALRLGDIPWLLEHYKSEKNPEGIVISADFGNHTSCYLDTNCPEAVRVRKALDEAGVKLEELAELHHSLLHEPPPVPYRFPPSLDISGKINVEIGGKRFEVETGDSLREQIERNLARRYNDFILVEERLRNTARDMYSNYVYQTEVSRRNRVLPQLHFPLRNLMLYHCFVSMGEGDRHDYYMIYFPIHYAPEYLTSDFKRWRILKAHQDAIVRDVLVGFPIFANWQMEVPLLYTLEGKKFQHYHGGSYDCWGSHRHKSKWDGSLEQLYEYSRELEKMLKTINKDSLMKPYPPGMPEYAELEKNATLLGEEGQYKKGSGKKDADSDEQPVNITANETWGGSTRETRRT